MLTLFHPASGEVRIKGVTSSANAILHPWLKAELSHILQTLPPPKELDAETNRKLWGMWQAGLSMPITLPETLPSLRMLLIWDNLRGHDTTDTAKSNLDPEMATLMPNDTLVHVS